MKVIQDLIDEMESALDKYTYEKYEKIDLDDKTETELFSEIQYFFKHFKEEAEELDETIDEIIEEANEPSLYDYDVEQDNIQRTRDLIRG